MCVCVWFFITVFIFIFSPGVYFFFFVSFALLRGRSRVHSRRRVREWCDGLQVIVRPRNVTDFELVIVFPGVTPRRFTPVVTITTEPILYYNYNIFSKYPEVTQPLVNYKTLYTYKTTVFAYAGTTQQHSICRENCYNPAHVHTIVIVTRVVVYIIIQKKYTLFGG